MRSSLFVLSCVLPITSFSASRRMVVAIGDRKGGRTSGGQWNTYCIDATR